MENENQPIAIGQRYIRRGAQRREFAWVVSEAHGSVAYRRADGGLASVPVGQFQRDYQFAPKP